MVDGSIGSQAVIREIVGAVLPRMPEFLERMVQLAAPWKPYASGTVPATDAMQSFRDNAECLLHCFAGTHEPGTERDAPTRTGYQRARQGVPVEDVLHMFRIGTRLLWDMLLSEARTRSQETQARFVDSATELLEATNRHSVAFADAYRRQEVELRRRSELHRDALVDSLLAGAAADAGVAAEAGVEFGFRAHGRFVVALLPLEPGWDETPRSPQAILAAQGMRSAWRRLAGRSVGIVELGSAPARRLAQLITASGVRRAGVSGEVEGLAELGVARQLAETALRTLPPDATGVAVLDERLPEAMIASSPQLAQRLAGDTIGRVLHDGENEVLLETLETWFDNERSATRTAELLHCHRNTVLNRLRRFETLTGRSLDDDRHQLSCRLALMSHRILGTAG